MLLIKSSESHFVFLTLVTLDLGLLSLPGLRLGLKSRLLVPLTLLYLSASRR